MEKQKSGFLDLKKNYQKQEHPVGLMPIGFEGVSRTFHRYGYTVRTHCLTTGI
jgi:hypothetical protein